jgi:hypothetical protein
VAALIVKPPLTVTMKLRYKILVGIMCALGIVSFSAWFAPGPVAGNYQVPQDFPGLAAVSHNFVQFSGGRILYWLEMDPPPMDAGSYIKTDHGWEWVGSPTNKVEALIEPHLLYMKLRFPDRGMKCETVYREFRFWKTARVLAEPKQSGKRGSKRLNKAATALPNGRCGLSFASGSLTCGADPFS